MEMNMERPNSREQQRQATLESRIDDMKSRAIGEIKENVSKAHSGTVADESDAFAKSLLERRWEFARNVLSGGLARNDDNFDVVEKDKRYSVSEIENIQRANALRLEFAKEQALAHLTSENLISDETAQEILNLIGESLQYRE